MTIKVQRQQERNSQDLDTFLFYRDLTVMSMFDSQRAVRDTVNIQYLG